jgi:ribonuclease-3
MNGLVGLYILDLLQSPDPDFNRIIDTFVIRFNAVYGIPGTDRWDITREDWQRYEFLGDRVLNLIIAQSLFSQRDAVLDEGEMTKILSDVVSNRALDALTRQYEKETFTRLIPRSIGEQNTYGERITGGAFEAFIGALYCEVGLDDVAFFINAIMRDALDNYNPRQNAIGILQEYFQKRLRTPPRYDDFSEDPQHHLTWHSKVILDNGQAYEGVGKDITESRQAAAKKALEKIVQER